MNFIDYALRDFPSNLHVNTGTAFKDIAVANGLSTGAIGYTSAPIVSGSAKSVVVGSAGANAYGFTDSNFIAGNEQKNFTLAIAALPLNPSSEVGLLSHYNSSPLDGIVISKDYIYFRVRFGAGWVEAKYEYDDMPDSFLIHATYLPSIIKLYVNGALVANADIPDGYTATGFNTSSGDGTLYAGRGSGVGDRVLIDVPATYPVALRDDQIQRQFEAMRDVVPMSVIINSAYGGVFSNGSERRIDNQKVFNSVDSWAGVSFTDVGWATGELIPTVDQSTGASKPGVWIGQYTVDNPENPTLSGIKAEWNGSGSYTVQTSLDGGTTWTAVTNGELVPTSQGLNSAGKIMLVKITFAGGVINDTSEVKNLTLTTYADNFIYTSGNNARKLTISGNVSTSLVPNEPIERNSRPGIHAYGGTLTMAQDTDASPVSIQTLEFWVNPKGVVSGSGGYLFDTRPYGGTAYMWLQETSTVWSWAGASAVYINGVAATTGAAAVKNDWTHILFVFPAPFNTRVDIAGGNQIADYNLIASYPTALTAGQAANVFKYYSTLPIMAATEAGTVTFTEPVNPFVFTVADWANLPQQ